MRRRSPDAGLLLFCALVGAIVAVVFWRFLTLRYAYLFTGVGNDSVNAFYPKIKHLFDYAATDGLPGWSFNVGLGQDIFPFSWNDPFYAILALFGQNRLAFGIVYMEAAKILAAGIFFFLCLRRLSLSGAACALGATLYSFSGYLVLGGGWTVFSTEAVWFALLLYAFERFLAGESRRALALAAALIAGLQPFFLFLYALFLSFYGSLRFVETRGWRPRAYAAFMARLAVALAAGALVSGAVSLSEVAQLLSGRRSTALLQELWSRPVFALATPKLYWTELARLFSTDILGAGWHFSGWRNWLEAPEFYCGLATLLLLPQAFVPMSRTHRKLHGCWLALLLLPSVFPFFRYALWAFSGDYFRSYSLIVAATLIILAARAFDRIERTAEIDKRVLLVSLGAALLALWSLPSAGAVSADPHLKSVAAALLVSYAWILFLSAVPKRAKTCGAALLALVCVEAAAFSFVTVSGQTAVSARELREKIFYNDYTNDAVVWLDSIDRSFFRIEKDYPSSPAVIGSLNDGMVQRYFGTSEYNSITQAAYADFLMELGLIDPALDPSARYLPGLIEREKLLSLVGVKYLFSKGRLAGRKKIAVFGDVNVYRNADALPLGVTFDRTMRLSDFRKLDARAKDEALLRSVVVDDAQERDFAGLSRSPREVLAIFKRSQNELEGELHLKGRKLLFFSIPYDRGWTARVDGRPADLRRVDIGFMGLVLEPGPHQVELAFASPLRRAGVWISLVGLLLCASL